MTQKFELPKDGHPLRKMSKKEQQRLFDEAMYHMSEMLERLCVLNIPVDLKINQRETRRVRQTKAP